MRYVLCAGEALIDFISKNPGKGLKGTEIFEKRAGGSPMNVAVGLARIGDRVKFLGKISRDNFGEFLIEFLEERGVETDLVVRDDTAKTTLAFVALDESGKPSFEFYGQRTADTALEIDEIPELNTEDISIFHFGSIALLFEPTGTTLEHLFEKLSTKVRTSFDPNIRTNLISDEKSYLKRIENILRRADVVKMSSEDAVYLTGSSDILDVVERYSRQDKITVLTMGSKGSVGFFDGNVIEKESWTPGEVLDTTGCGDAYMAGLIHVLSNVEEFSKEALERAMDFGTVLAGFVATRYGAASAMPSFEEIEGFLERD